MANLPFEKIISCLYYIYCGTAFLIAVDYYTVKYVYSNANNVISCLLND